MYKRCSYFGLLVQVGSVFGEDLADRHFIVLGREMEGREAALQEEHTSGLMWLLCHRGEERPLQCLIDRVIKVEPTY